MSYVITRNPARPPFFPMPDLPCTAADLRRAYDAWIAAQILGVDQ
jgi:hypothetical protein